MRRIMLIALLPLLTGNANFVLPQRVVILPSAVECNVPLELWGGGGVTPRYLIASGLHVGQCIDLHPAIRVRVCCPGSPRVCGELGEGIEPMGCQRVTP